MISITKAQNLSFNKIEINPTNMKFSTIDMLYSNITIWDDKEVKFEINMDVHHGKAASDSIGQSILQSKDFPRKLSYSEIAAYYTSKVKTVWLFDPSKAKGSGTKNTFSKTNTKPKLLWIHTNKID